MSGSVEAVVAPPKLAPPPHYQVVMLNDDVTTMDFVIDILMDIFQMDYVQAERVMYRIHEQGSAVCGIYCKEIAETKAEQVHHLAREAGFPLRCQLQPISRS
ncbi:MAG: ATP-dependent Clp protease adaptor ClpS [Cardiobacteriaceae bacterium]|nr:ATP-dependent Clp protease adaptor ClpS [Cardiobacteriaceae bacterium]